MEHHYLYLLIDIKSTNIYGTYWKITMYRYLQLIFPLKNVIFRNYVSLPEANTLVNIFNVNIGRFNVNSGCCHVNIGGFNCKLQLFGTHPVFSPPQSLHFMVLP